MPLVFDHVTYCYGLAASDSAPALSDVSLSIADGEFITLVGHTGSGKSTLAQLCNALLLPTSGTVAVDGIPTSDRRRRRDLRRLVGYVGQYSEHQLFAETVAEDVAFGPRNLGMSQAEVDAAVRDALAVVGLDGSELGEVSPFDLSGGQQRRVALAGVIAMRPKVLVLDEPMVGLDPQGRAEVLSIVSDLHAQGSTVVMVSHSMEDVATVAQRVVVLNHGRVADEGTPREVFSHREILQAAGLEAPLPMRVAADLKACGWDFGDDIPLTLDELADAVAACLAGTRACAHGEGAPA